MPRSAGKPYRELLKFDHSNLTCFE